MSVHPRTRLAKIATGTLAAAAVAVPLALTAAPAQAASSGGCTVTPLAPVVTGKIGNTKIVRYSVGVSCVKDRILRVYQQRWEADSPAGLVNDDFQGSSQFDKTFAVAGSTTFSSYRLLADTELGYEEIYHRVAFKVASINGVTAWTAYQNSPTVSILN